VLWWGFGVMALATGGVPGMLGPAVLTYLLLYISGVTLVESTMTLKAGYSQYAGKTPAFFPMPAPMRAKLMEKVRNLQKKPPPPPSRRYY
jgi:steroid 5-alpha reductase family enzyme